MPTMRKMGAKDSDNAQKIDLSQSSGALGKGGEDDIKDIKDLSFSRLLNKRAGETKWKSTKSYYSNALKVLENSEFQSKLDVLFVDAIQNKRNRIDIVTRLEEITEEYKYLENLPSAEEFYAFAKEAFSAADTKIRNELHVVVLRRGAAGGFSLVQKENVEKDLEFINKDEQFEKEIKAGEESIKKGEEVEKRLEKHYYPLVKNWALSNNFEQCQIAGGLISGASWENPDLIEIYINKDDVFNSVEIEVTSFEVKLRMDPYGIWQAAHYRNFSHRTFIAFAMTEEEVRKDDNQKLFELAIGFGLGILVLSDNTSEFKLIHSPLKLKPQDSEISCLIKRLHERVKNDQFRTLSEALTNAKQAVTELFLEQYKNIARRL